MTGVFIGFLTIILLLSIRYVMLSRLSNKIGLESLKYDFYAVRDELIKLVAEGKLSKDDFLFREFYPLVNDFIIHIKKIRIDRLLKVSEDQINHMDSTEFAEMFVKEYEKAPDEVKQVVKDFFYSYEKTLIYNSNFIGITLLLIRVKLSKFANVFMEYFVKSFSPLRYSAYRYYNEVQDLQMRLRV